MKNSVLFFLLSFILLPSLSVANNDKLIVAFVEWPPYNIYEGDNEISGILKDLVDEVVTRLDIEVEYKKYPQKRMKLYFQKGLIGLEAGANPVWRPNDRLISLYSIPVLETQEVIIVNELKEISGDYKYDLKGATIGTILGYNYDATINDDLKANLFQKHESLGHKRNIELLFANRVDGIVIQKRVFDFWVKKLNLDPDNFKVAYKVGPSTAISFRLHKDWSDLLPQINSILSELIESNFVAQLTKKHTAKAISE